MYVSHTPQNGALCPGFTPFVWHARVPAYSSAFKTLTNGALPDDRRRFLTSPSSEHALRISAKKRRSDAENSGSNNCERTSESKVRFIVSCCAGKLKIYVPEESRIGSKLAGTFSKISKISNEKSSSQFRETLNFTFDDVYFQCEANIYFLSSQQTFTLCRKLTNAATLDEHLIHRTIDRYIIDFTLKRKASVHLEEMKLLYSARTLQLRKLYIAEGTNSGNEL